MAALSPLGKPKMAEKGTEKLLSEADRSKLSTTGGNPEAFAAHRRLKDLDAQQRLREQQEDQAHAAQGLLEVPRPQGPGPQMALDRDGSRFSSENHRTVMEPTAQPALRVSGPDARLPSEDNE